jgi:HD-GYP domain-containing protein (c-di-GMP phosphodiesterase class II)
MVNVAILTLAQARALDIEGTRLRELGIAALLHDIGKIRTPREILTSTVPLTDREFAIIKQHPVDGASLLRCTPGMPAIVPIVALEHHLRLDGAGYPERSSRPSLNLGTMLCAIADVYDAMRSSRSYQRSHPPDRIIGVLRKNDGRQFDQRLVDRFVRLMGIYPPGTMVQLTSGEVGVVQQTNDGDVRQPTVRLLVDRKGVTIPSPHTRTLWRESDDEAARLARAVDPALYRIDLLPHMVNG